MSEIPSKTILKLTKEISPKIDELTKHSVEEMIKETDKISREYNLDENFVFYSIFKSFIHTLFSPLDLQTQHRMIEDLKKGMGIALEMSNRSITKETIDEIKKGLKKESQRNIGYS